MMLVQAKPCRQTIMYATRTRGSQFVYTAWWVIGPTIFKVKHSILRYYLHTNVLVWIGCAFTFYFVCLFRRILQICLIKYGIKIFSQKSWKSQIIFSIYLSFNRIRSPLEKCSPFFNQSHAFILLYNKYNKRKIK